jgi:hypothetical protein
MIIILIVIIEYRLELKVDICNLFCYLGFISFKNKKLSSHRKICKMLKAPNY